MNKIQDEFTDLKIGGQRRYQLRHKRDGLCRFCSNPAMKGFIQCTKHHLKKLEHERKEYGVKRYNQNTKFNRLLKEQAC